MVKDHQGESSSLTAAAAVVAKQLGVGKESVRRWVIQSQIDDPQALLDAFVEEYNDHRPHRSLDHRTTPATIYTTRPKATPSTGDRDADTHDRVRYDKVDKSPLARPGLADRNWPTTFVGPRNSKPRCEQNPGRRGPRCRE